MDRDVRVARVYFDLNAVSVVEDDVRAVMREVKAAGARCCWRCSAGRSRAFPARTAAVVRC